MSPLILVFAGEEAPSPELTRALEPLQVRFVPAREVVESWAAPDEEGTTAEAVAVRRAEMTCSAASMMAVAEAGGLEVDALGGRPGIRAERFAHERATDAENNAVLLRELEDVPEGDRTARFRWVMAVASPWGRGKTVVVEGTAEGTIARTPSGSGGFGYEPLFVVAEGHGCPLSELDEDLKRRVSARSRAAQTLAPQVLTLMNDILDQTERVIGGAAS